MFDFSEWAVPVQRHFIIESPSTGVHIQVAQYELLKFNETLSFATFCALLLTDSGRQTFLLILLL
tara:strand:- start:11374 stop:11568 length:195 start_codon:yes stop_codon:yes gene_type:complete